MADSIRFKELLVCNTAENKTIEMGSKALFAYAGIHDWSFEDEISEDFDSLSSSIWYTGAADGTWEIISNQLRGTGGGASRYYTLRSVSDMPSEAVLRLYKNGNDGGVIFRSIYMFFWTATNCGFKKYDGSSWNILLSIPKAYTGEGDITLSWREIKFSANADEKWLFMSAWVDGELACTTEDDISDSAPGNKIGFAIQSDLVCIFDSLRIAELTEIIDWCSMDIGESPGGALSRIIGRRHINYFLRYDGTLKMWRPKSASSTYTYQRHITGFNWNVDTRNLVGHWRQVGAWEEADRFDVTLLQRGITRFHKDNNPDLMTREACHIEAGYAIQKLTESSDRIDMSVPAQVLGEPEDVVTVTFARDGNTVINSADYIVDLKQSYTIAFQGGKLGSTLHLRKQQVTPYSEIAVAESITVSEASVQIGGILHQSDSITVAESVTVSIT